MTRPHKHSDSEPQVSPETEYLVTDMERYVNENVEEYLDGYPTVLKATDYHVLMTSEKKLPIGIRRIDNAYVSRFAPSERTFDSVDILMQFPIQPEAENPINIVFKWTDGTHCRIAIVDKRPLLLVENGDTTLHSAFINIDEMNTYLTSCGLPKSIWGANLDQVIEDIDSSSDIHTYQRVNAAIDPFTTLEIVHEMRFKTNAHESKKVLDELCLNIDHLGDEAEITLANNIYLPPTPTYRNMLRFEQAEENEQDSDDINNRSSWSYRGAYSGKLEAGEFIDELVQIDPKLVIPNTKVVSKALAVLSQKPY